jgi:hypothetical protein
MAPEQNSAHHTITGGKASRGAWYHQLDEMCGMSMPPKACLKLAGHTHAA